MTLSTLTPTVATATAYDAAAAAQLLEQSLEQSLTAHAEQYWGAHELHAYFAEFSDHVKRERDQAECELYQQKMAEAEAALQSLGGYTGMQAVNEFLEPKYAREEADALRTTVGDRA